MKHMSDPLQKTTEAIDCRLDQWAYIVHYFFDLPFPFVMSPTIAPIAMPKLPMKRQVIIGGGPAYGYPHSDAPICLSLSHVAEKKTMNPMMANKNIRR